MKLICNVEINQKSAVGSGELFKKKTQLTCLVIGKQSTKNHDLCLFLSTRQSNHDIKYKISDNIENIFTRFVNEGKVTIRFKEPAHDLQIKTKNAIELKSFLHILKMGIEKKLTPDVITMTKPLNLKNTNLMPKKKVIIKKKADYPVLEGFPRTVEELSISGLERKSFDRQILRLQSLRVLNLSNNLIETLPSELGSSLPHLAELNLSQNRLGGSTNFHKTWLWFNGISVIKSLRLLDISFNQIKVLPNQIGKLNNLLTLNISNNELDNLSVSIGNLIKLKFLNFSNNNINLLPGAIQNIRFDTLNISGNFIIDPQLIDISNSLAADNNCVPTLKEVAARGVINNRFFYDASTIPYTLIKYLDNAYFCLCGKSCFDVHIRRIVTADLRRFACSIISSTANTSNIPFHCIYCSLQCFNKFSKMNM